MSLAREEVLIDCLKHVSLQRLRSLKMDMQKLSRDSRIANERNFWSLLEFHHIILDERTKREFRGEILDNRGINIETALRHLKLAQRKTGRDSVEVLIKENQPRAMSARSRPTTRSTPISKVETQKRNYKLDKLRSKAIGIGKLRAAFKSPTVQPALPNIPKTSPTEQPTENVKTPKRVESTEEVSKKEKARKSEKEKDTVKATQNNGDKGSLSLFKMLLQEEGLKNTENESPSSKDDQVTVEKNSKPMSKTHTKNESTMVEIEPTAPNKSIQEKLLTQSPNTEETTILSDMKEISHDDLIKDVPKDFENKSTVDNKKVTSDKQSALETSLENQSKDKHRENNESLATRVKEIEITPEVTEDKVKPSDNHNQIDMSINNNTSNTKNLSTSEQEGLNDVKALKSEITTNEIEHKSVETKLSESGVIESVVIEMEMIDPNPPQLQKNILEDDKKDECKTEDDATNKVDDIHNNENGSKITTKESEIVTQGSEAVTEESKPMIEEINCVNLKIDKEEINNLKTKETKNVSIDSHQADGPASHNKKTEKEIKKREKKTKQKVKPSIKKDEKLNKVEQVDKEIVDKSEEKQEQEEDVIIEEQDIIQAQSFSDTHSVSTLSSVDDETFSLDDIIRDMSSSACGTEEEIHVGESTVLMQIPEWIKENEHKFNNPGPLRNKIEVDWVYGCSTTYPQCMASLPSGNLVYYVGCIVIVYDHERKTQKHYLGHSATISSISAHPNLQHVASAQFSFSTKISTPNKSRDHGKIHVRIWNAVSMETMHVVGVGTLRDPIFKMQFLLMEGYLVTIENNDDNTMTVWDGGCRVTSTSLTPPSGDQFTNNQKLPIAWNHKKFVPTLPRSTYRPPAMKNLPLSNNKKTKEKRASPIKLNTSGARGLTFNHNDDGGFACVGKHHLTFWQIEVDYEEEGGVKLAEPVNGDFGKFFRAEYLSCCLATNKFLDGSIITGDSNGTLLIWSEKTRTATRGFSHAHECHLSAICVSDEGLIFTAGVRDKTVKAFLCKHSKIELCGVLEIPPDTGSASSLIAIDNTLFVATESHVIISVPFELVGKTTDAMSASLRASGKKSVTSSDEGGMMTSSVFGEWNEYEVARGFRKGVRSCCSISPLQEKTRTRNAENKDIKLPGVDESLEIMRSQYSKQTGVRKYLRDTTTRSNRNNIIDDVKRPTASTSSPRLRAHERILQRCRNETNVKPTPYFSTYNVVRKSDVFCDDDTRTAALGDYFVTSSNNGWMYIYSSKEHTILARLQLPQPCDVTCVDTCSKRHLVCVGTSTGHVFLTRINNKGFEILPQLQCKCSGGGLPYINTVRFSPSGRKVAISIGYDVIIATVRRLAITELGRCIGHHSDVIIGLDWSSKKYSSTYFLRSCAINPAPEIKTWHSDTMLEVRSLDLLNRVTWASTSSILDYSTKGIWGNFLKCSDVMTSCVHSVPLKVENDNKDDTAKCDDGGKNLVVGDASGAISIQNYPCLRWIDNDNTRKAHFSPINTIAVLSEQRHLLTTGKYEDSLVQWTLLN